MATATSEVKVTPELIEWIKHQRLVPSTLTYSNDDPFWPEKVAELLADGKLTIYDYALRTESAAKPRPQGAKSMATTVSPSTVFARGSGDITVRNPSDKYSNKKFEGRHVKTGLAVPNPFNDGRPTETPSQRDFAKAGVLFKHLANKAGLGTRLSPDEFALMKEMAMSDVWAGDIDGEHGYFTGVKSLLDDSLSGGIHISPNWFDDAIITQPLLSGELFPYLDLVDVPKGKTVDGGAIDTPTLTWGTEDNESITLFTTDSLVSQIDTSIHAVTVAIEIGRDFLSDAGVDVGKKLTTLIGERLAAELDKMTVSGNGTTQPTGIFNASGLPLVTTENGNGGPPTLADYLTLMFSIGKQYRNPAMRCAFISNDTSYQRNRSIAIDTASPSTDQRPVFGLEAVNSYMTLDWRHAIQNDLANTQGAFGALSRYRMYRRMGLSIRFEQGGKELARKNLVLLIARARFGGQVMDADAFAAWTDGQS